MRTTLGYPDHDHEVEVLRMLADGLRPEGLTPVMSTSDVRNMIEVAEHVHVEDSIRSSTTSYPKGTRTVEHRVEINDLGGFFLPAAGTPTRLDFAEDPDPRMNLGTDAALPGGVPNEFSYPVRRRRWRRRSARPSSKRPRSPWSIGARN